MNMNKIPFVFDAVIWQHQSAGGWFFASLPMDMSREIREHLKWQEEGWGRLKATAKINNTQWETAIWYDSKFETYLLPLKADVRKSENLILKKEVNITIYI